TRTALPAVAMSRAVAAAPTRAAGRIVITPHGAGCAMLSTRTSGSREIRTRILRSRYMTKPNDLDITRKDFINAALVGVGAALLKAPAPLDAMQRAAQSTERAAEEPDTFTGPGGVGDYASSNGNTKAVMDAAHKIRDDVYGRSVAAVDTREVYDLVVVGGGITGLTAAYFFAKSAGASSSCLVLDNHPIFGGEAKQNEFLVNGTRLMAPQGSNDFGVPR